MPPAATAPRVPSLQFVLDGVPFGGVGRRPRFRTIATRSSARRRSRARPSSRRAAPFPRSASLRQYPDEFGGTASPTASSLRRPFLDRETGFSDRDRRRRKRLARHRRSTRRRVSRARRRSRRSNAAKNRTQSDVDRDLQACARKPARVFIANRSPASLLVGEVGAAETTASDATTPTASSSTRPIPLSAGPSKLYLAPVVERDGAYALRVFVVCFDSATVFVFDPDTEQARERHPRRPRPLRDGVRSVRRSNEVATHAQVPFDPRAAGTGLRRYRFAYLASFTNSFVQVIDLDNAQRRPLDVRAHRLHARSSARRRRDPVR